MASEKVAVFSPQVFNGFQYTHIQGVINPLVLPFGMNFCPCGDWQARMFTCALGSMEMG
ncbi:hypothetical protein [Spirulina subsalsa]|uniref:hypothetical protein n=1 Tax=Spirulina subsalsa TaxID=54311 RepID=UPI0002E0BF50|nr:hypothetical protein [Spirulina subsalsa]